MGRYFRQINKLRKGEGLPNLGVAELNYFNIFSRISKLFVIVDGSQPNYGAFSTYGRLPDFNYLIY